jgi:ubiquinone biosynthesis protein Coq4
VGCFFLYSILDGTSLSSLIMNNFNPKDYIVTVDGFRGYVVKRLDYCHNMYEIRLTSGLTVRGGEELKLDELMYQEA